MDFTPFSFILIASVFYHSIYYTRVFEVGPITKELLYDTIFDGLMIVNSAGSIIEHNRCFLNLFATNPGQIVGKDASAIFDSEGYPGAAILNTVNSPLCLLSNAQSTLTSWQITATPLKSQDKLYGCTLYIFRDVTDIERSVTEANQALETAENARESITRNLSDMSHEIRTPLMGILGAAHQLKADACDEEQESDAVEILAGAEELLETVNRILDYSKLDAGKMNTYEEVFTLDSYTETLDSFSFPDIKWTASTELVAVCSLKGNRHHTEQLIRLLHSFLNESGTKTITMDLGYKNESLLHTMRFKIPLKEARETLECWNHLEEFLTKPVRINPLKLVLVQKLAAFMHATLTLKRLDFEWRLQLSVPIVAVSEMPATQLAFAVELDCPRKLLFAEDSIINQAVIRQMLKTLPWDITFASNGIEALALCENTLYDGIFTDVHMPGLGGIELSYSLQETINRSTPIFALTSDTDAELQEMVAQSPIKELIVKPCPKEKLVQLLHEYPRIHQEDDTA